VTKTAVLSCLAERQSRNQNAFRRVAMIQGHPWLSAMLAALVWKADMTRAPFSPRSRRGVRQHVMRSAPRPAPLRSTCLAARRTLRTRDASDRLLPSHLFVPVPAPRRFSVGRLLAQPLTRGDCLIHVSANSLRRVARDPFHGAVHRDGRCLPVVMRAYRASDTPVASPAMP